MAHQNIREIVTRLKQWDCLFDRPGIFQQRSITFRAGHSRAEKTMQVSAGMCAYIGITDCFANDRCIISDAFKRTLKCCLALPARSPGRCAFGLLALLLAVDEAIVNGNYARRMTAQPLYKCLGRCKRISQDRPRELRCWSRAWYSAWGSKRSIASSAHFSQGSLSHFHDFLGVMLLDVTPDFGEPR